MKSAPESACRLDVEGLYLDTCSMNTPISKGKTPSFHSRLPDPNAGRPVVDGETLYSIKDTAFATGLTVRTLQTYASHRRCSRFMGPKPCKIPFNNRLWYRESDIELFLSEGFTGAPDDPNGDAGEQ